MSILDLFKSSASGKMKRDTIIKQAIGNAYNRNRGEFLETQIYWEAAERFAQDRGEDTYIGGDGGRSISCKMLVDGEEVFVSFVRNGMNGTAYMTVENNEEMMREFKESWGIES